MVDTCSPKTLALVTKSRDGPLGKKPRRKYAKLE